MARLTRVKPSVTNMVRPTLLELKKSSVAPGEVYETFAFREVGDGGGAIYHVTTPKTGVVPNGYGDHVADNGLHLMLLSTPTDLNHGVIINQEYVPQEARYNRNALQAMLRNTSIHYCESTAIGRVWVLGSINVSRNDLHWWIKKGCQIRGRYSDPSIPTPDQAGGMINFADFFDPDSGDFIPWRPEDTRINGHVRNIHVRLDGDVSTEYNAAHINPYNNNCIGFAKAVDCSVRGTGGVSESDHRGINFDGFDDDRKPLNKGGNVNCHVDVAYINNTVDNPVMIVGDKVNPSTCTIKVGSIRNMPEGGYKNPIVVNVSNGADFEVWVGRFNKDSGTSPSLVTARNCSSVKVRGGYIRGCANLLYTVDTLDNDVSVEEIYDTPIGIYRGGTSGAARSFKFHGLKYSDSSFRHVFSNAVSGSFARLEISDNNFSYTPADFRFATGGKAVLEIIRDNLTPSQSDNTKLNILTGQSKTITFSDSSVMSHTINFKDGNWNYTKMTLVVAYGGGRGIATLDLTAKEVTSNSIIIKAGDYPVTVTGGANSGSVTLATTRPQYLNYVVLHN